MPKPPVCMPKPASQVPTKSRHRSVAVAAMASGAGDRDSVAPEMPLDFNDAKHQDWAYKSRTRASLTHPSRRAYVPRAHAVWSTQREEGIPVVPERLDDLVSSPSSMEGGTVTVKDLAEGIKSWSQEREREERASWGHRSLP
ncbi:hypothetical protein J4Q44_G00083140 [Coregonus suidteri]|uniref:Uncharacterized protein n=1 Tax=Coregonus suidteri TaxID=861788 RepID=A0AAN8M0P4_9TELE